MTAQPSEKKTGKILTPTEREICENIAAQGDTLNSQRAKVLLLIDEGITQANACATSDMSIGQLRYALTLFRKSGMQMFPQDKAIAQEPEDVAEAIVEPTEPIKSVETETAPDVPKKKKSKDKGKKKKKVKKQKVAKPKKKKKKKKKK